MFHQLKPHRYGLWAKTSKAEYSTCMGFTGVLWFLAKLAIFCVIDNIFSQYLLFGVVWIIGERRHTPIVIPIYVVVQIPLHCFIKCPIPYVQELKNNCTNLGRQRTCVFQLQYLCKEIPKWGHLTLYYFQKSFLQLGGPNLSGRMLSISLVAPHK